MAMIWENVSDSDEDNAHALTHYRKAANGSPYFASPLLFQLSLLREMGKMGEYWDVLQRAKQAIDDAVKAGKKGQFKKMSLFITLFDEVEKNDSPILQEILNILRKEVPIYYDIAWNEYKKRKETKDKQA